MSKLIESIFNCPHVILPGKLNAIAGVVADRENGVSRTEAEVTAIVCESKPPQLSFVAASGEKFAARSEMSNESKIAVLPLFGTIMQHAGIITESSGGTSTERFISQLRQLDADQSIGTVVIETHSPGGQVFGTAEAASELYAMREAGRTRFVTLVNSMMASGALWIGTAANEVVITPGGEAGSLGVVTIHTDISGAEEKIGQKTTLIATPAKKVQGNPYEPLSEDAISEIQDRNEQVYKAFVADVARNRGVKQSEAIERFGGGGMLNAQESVSAGLADAVMSKNALLDKLVAGLQDRRRGQIRRRRAELDILEASC